MREKAQLRRCSNAHSEGSVHARERAHAREWTLARAHALLPLIRTSTMGACVHTHGRDATFVAACEL
eukprot:6208550-Pleurochrysis_carterae.AAC.3